MKNLILVAILAFNAVVTLGQDKTDKPPANPQSKITQEYYMMKDGKLMHFNGENCDTVKSEIALKNGTVVTPQGEVKQKSGKVAQLKNGQCISLTGGVGNCGKQPARIVDNKGRIVEQGTLE